MKTLFKVRPKLNLHYIRTYDLISERNGTLLIQTGTDKNELIAIMLNLAITEANKYITAHIQTKYVVIDHYW